MKNKITVVLALVFVFTSTQAQNPQQRMRLRMERQHLLMRQQPELSDEQKNKFKSLQEDFRKNMMDLRKKDDITVKEWRSRMENLQKKHQEDMQSIFTPEQKERMKLQKNRMADINARAKMNRLPMRLRVNPGPSERLYKLYRVMPDRMQNYRGHQFLNMQKRRAELRWMMERRYRNLKTIPMFDQKRRMEQLRMYRLRKPGKLS